MSPEELARIVPLRSEYDQFSARIEELERQVADLSGRVPEDRATIVMFGGDLDKVLAGFIIAAGAATAGLETSIFFTFWGLSALKKKEAQAAGRKDIKERLFAMMTPSGSTALGVSRMNFMGIGASMMRSMMKDKGVASLEELMDVTRELGVRFIACTMTMDIMAVSKEELIDGLEYGGVATYMADAARSRVTLFI